MGRGKVEMKRIENNVRRQVTFSKRRRGLLKKAHELAVLCDAHLGVVIFSGTGRLFHYCSPHTSWRELVQRHDSITNAQLEATDQQMSGEIARLRCERDQLEASIRRQTGEDLSSVTAEELVDLQKQLESALGKVRKRKDELLNQQLEESRHKVHILEDHNSVLNRVINEYGQHRAVSEASAMATEGMATPMLPSTAFGRFFPEVEEELSTSLQLWPQQLPAVQDFGLQDHSLRQWL